jgi:Tol biopolymer transport system component
MLPIRFVLPTAAVCGGLAIAVAASIKRTVTVTEGTNLALTASPDHQRIIFGLQGVLWSVPISGGVAKALTDPLLDPARPDWSPKGDLVAFEAFAGGTFHIWTMKPDGTGVRQVTFGHGDDREPRFSPDGSQIAFSSDRAFQNSYDIWSVDLADGKLTQRTFGAEDKYEPVWSPDGSEIAFVSGPGAAATTVRAINVAGTQRILATAAEGAHVDSPAWSPDGKTIAYVDFAANQSRLMIAGRPVSDRNDVFPFPPVWLDREQLLYAANGKMCLTKIGAGTREIPFQPRIPIDRPSYLSKKFDFDSTAAKPVKGIVGPAISPDGKRIVFQALNQLWLMEIGKAPEQITHDTYYKEDPTWSPDGSQIAYSSDKAGTEDLYVLDLRTRTERRVTSLADSAEVSPAWSPDGKSLAFHDQTGATYTITLDTGKIRKILGAQFEPSKPSWSANGKTIAIGAVKPYTRRFREGTSQILTAEVVTGAVTYSEPAPFQSLSTRGEDGPVYAPDGSAMAYVVGSVLWIRPVDSSGIPTGEARQVTREVTDAPTWSGDSKHLLYLSNGKLRLVSVDGGDPQTVPLEMTAAKEKPAGGILIHAGKLWDGRGAEEQTNVDIIVSRNRVQSIQPHSDAAHRNAARQQLVIVDASDRTVIPGIWESHTHEWISGKYYGDRLGRLWLAYGITTLHSQGDPAYRALETRESFDSGTRVGPRFFATGEAIDGERVYYNFMRPTTSGTQLALELSRAEALEYDSLKTYVRLPHSMQKDAMQFAHGKLGIPVASHYLLPGLGYGMDGMTHVAATSRYGFANTRSAAGATYQDVRSLLPASGMFDISTAFASQALYAEDPAMVDDARLLTLNTPWDEAALRAKRDRAVYTDQSVTLDTLRKEEETVGSLYRAGGLILTGTDSPLDNVATALHLGLRAQVKFGLAPWQALQTATLLPAKAFGVAADLGTVEPGKLADLVFIEGDPIRDIKTLANVRGVMKNGKMHSIADLMRPFVRDPSNPEDRKP